MQIKPMLAVLLLAGCSAPADERLLFASDELRVLANDGEFLCAGTVDAVRAEYARIAELHGADATKVTEPLDVVVGPSADDNYCVDAKLAGCAGRTESGVLKSVGTIQTVSHELVHGYRLQHGLWGNRFFEEGFAEYHRAGVLSSFSTSDFEASPAELVAEFQQDLGSYIAGARFLGYLSDRFGEGEVVAAMSAPEFAAAGSEAAVSGWLQNSFGASLDELSEAWLAQPRRVILDREGPCSGGGPLLTTSASARATVDCDGEGIGPFAVEDAGLGRLGDEMPMTTLPECFEVPVGVGWSIVNESEDPLVVVRVVPWSCTDAGKDKGAASLLEPGEAASVEAACLVEVTAKGAVGGFEYAWGVVDD